MRASFVVLHYGAKEATLECVRSILNLDRNGFDVSVVVVENGSNDHIQGFLKDQGVRSGYIRFLVSQQNLGFAKGNDLGYRYARENLDPDFLVAANNDVVFSQEDFLENAFEVLERTGCDILGPDIYNPLMSVHQSPLSGDYSETADDIRAMREGFKRKLGALEANRITVRTRYVLKGMPALRCAKAHIVERYGNHPVWNKPTENVELQGSCIVFSRSYLERMPWAFYPGTFMYLEEKVLMHVAKHLGMTMRYDPSIQVSHMHGVSTAQAFSDMRRRDVFFSKENIKSADELLRLIEEPALIDKVIENGL